MIDQVEMMKVIDRFREDAVVVPTMRANGAWAQVSRNEKRDIPTGGAMGKTSSFALGMCLAQPDTKFIVYDGDGSLVMNLGSLVTIGDKAPGNMYHFVLDNGVYATTGGQDVPGAGVTDYADMARAAGYRHTYEFTDLEDFATQAEEIFNQEGPVLVWVKTIPDIRLPEERAAGRGQRPRDPIADLMSEFGVRA